MTIALLAGLAAAGPAAAQSAASAIDQPTAGTLPAGTSTVKGTGGSAASGQVSPPSALAPSTDVMAGGKGSGQRVDPKEHLPDSMRRTK
ncbi:hypothetical protein MKK53_16435 [Methylobacterium sp. J-076]|nr:hypothetical protein [Methylobacterium sp. J-076]